jgi:hypothetical protein
MVVQRASECDGDDMPKPVMSYMPADFVVIVYSTPRARGLSSILYSLKRCCAGAIANQCGYVEYSSLSPRIGVV